MCSLLYDACLNSDESVLKALLTGGVVNAAPVCVMAAAWNSNERVMAMLIGAGANVDCVDADSGETPLHVCAQRE